MNRLIFYHKQHTSARLRFLKFANGSICGFDTLPELSQMLDSSIDRYNEDDNVVLHPAHLLREASDKLGLDVESLKVQGGYHARVDTSNGTVQVYLTELTTMDPPFERAADIDAEFIELTQARNLSVVELELLRLAYEYVM
jgi:hypothetical protein